MKFTTALLALLTPPPSTPAAGEPVVEADDIRPTAFAEASATASALARGQQQEQKREQTPGEVPSAHDKAAATTSLDPPPFAVASETAEDEEATVDIGLLEQRHLLLATATCPTDADYVNCVNGFVAFDTGSYCSGTCDENYNCSGTGTCRRCADECSGDCCVGDRACHYTTACIEKDNGNPNCYGYKACYSLADGNVPPNKPIISGGSCQGSAACHNVGSSGGYVRKIIESCHGNYACYELAHRGDLRDIENSCKGSDNCCYGLCNNNQGTCGRNVDVVGTNCLGTNSAGDAENTSTSGVGSMQLSCSLAVTISIASTMLM